MHKSHFSSRFDARFWVLFLALMFGNFAVDGIAAETDELKLMSFNIRYLNKSGEDKTENNWNDSQHPRRERAIRVIQSYSPDILGVQEAVERQIKDLQAP